MSTSVKQGYGWHIKKNLQLAWPVMLSQVGHVLTGTADGLMVGRLGEVPLAANAFALSLTSLFLMFSIGLSYGITPLVATAHAGGHFKRIIILLRHSLVLNGVAVVLLCGLFFAGVMPFLSYFDQPTAVVQEARQYVVLIALSLIPVAAYQAFRQFMEGLSQTRPAMYISVVGNIINIVLNWLLIYGKAGMPELGLAGAGWGTLISRVVMGIGLGLYLYYVPRFKRYRAGFNLRALRPQKKVFGQMLRIGVPSGLQYVFEVGAFTSATLMVGWLGATALAAHQIAMNLSTITYVLASGIASAATIRVGNQLGLKDRATMRRAGYSCFLMVALFMVCTGTTFIVGKTWLAGLYINSPEVVAVASSMLVVAAFFQISDGVQVVGHGALRGMADARIPTLYSMVAYWVLGLPAGYLLAFAAGMGAVGIWLGLLIGLSASALLILLRFERLSRRIALPA